jgi:hypothetical protein
MEVERNFSCYTCGKGTECFKGEPLHEGLRGWITLAQWRPTGEVSHYAFCCYRCLKAWVDSLAPKVPRIFLDSFGEDDN